MDYQGLVILISISGTIGGALLCTIAKGCFDYAIITMKRKNIKDPGKVKESNNTKQEPEICIVVQ